MCNANDKDGKFCSDRKSQTRKRSFSRPRLRHPFHLHPPSKAAPPKKTPEDVVAPVLSDMGSRPGVSAKPVGKVEPVWESGNAAKPAALRPPALSSPVGIPVLHVEHLPVYLGAFCKTSPPLPRNLALWPPAPLQPPPPPPPPPPPVNSLTCPWNMKRLYILDALNLLTHRNQGEENDKSLRWSQLESAAQYYHHGAQVLIFSEWLRGHSLELHRLEMRFGPGCVVSTPAEEGVDSVDTLMLKKAMMERQNGGKAFIVTNNRLEKFKSCADVDLSNLVVKYAMALSTFIPQDLQG